MAVIVSLFNHKGGVSKTTTAFNLGWKLARLGRRVMMIDCDPQCNLTGMVLGLSNVDEDNTILGETEGIPNNIREGLRPAFESRPVPMKPVNCLSVPKNPNLFLMPGNIGLAEYETTLGIAQELSGSVVTLKNLPGSLRHLIDITCQKYAIDVAIVDLSPSLGAINQNLLSISDLFLVPMAPDYFSTMAINSISDVLPRWKKWLSDAQNSQALAGADYPFPKKNPKFLGYIVQRYRPRNGAPSRAFLKWIAALESGVKDTLLPALKLAGMLLDHTVYDQFDADPHRPLLQMSDFNSLIALSQEHQTPIFELTKEQINQQGSVLQITEKSRDDFDQLFQVAGAKILGLIDASRV